MRGFPKFPCCVQSCLIIPSLLGDQHCWQDDHCNIIRNLSRIDSRTNEITITTSSGCKLRSSCVGMPTNEIRFKIKITKAAEPLLVSDLHFQPSLHTGEQVPAAFAAHFQSPRGACRGGNAPTPSEC